MEECSKIINKSLDTASVRIICVTVCCSVDINSAFRLVNVILVLRPLNDIRLSSKLLLPFHARVRFMNERFTCIVCIFLCKLLYNKKQTLYTEILSAHNLLNNVHRLHNDL